MTWHNLRSSDLQSNGDLDRIRNSCDVFLQYRTFLSCYVRCKLAVIFVFLKEFVAIAYNCLSETTTFFWDAHSSLLIWLIKTVTLSEEEILHVQSWTMSNSSITRTDNLFVVGVTAPNHCIEKIMTHCTWKNACPKVSTHFVCTDICICHISKTTHTHRITC